MGQFNVIDQGYTHIQASAATSWNVVHNLGRSVVIDVYVTIDGTDTKILPLNVSIVDSNTALITFSSARSGKARVA